MKFAKQKKIVFLFAGLLAGCLAFTVYFSWNQSVGGGLQVTFFDVGQGDVTLIQTPSHQQILIDGGPDTSVVAKLGKALPFYDRSIDLVILTHPHADHLIGLVEASRRYTIKHVLYGGVSSTDPAYQEWLRIVQEQHVPMTIAQRGMQFQFSDTTLNILYPFDAIQYDEKDQNKNSIVAQLKYQNTSFLFTGDAPEEIEQQLLRQPDTLKSDVLKVGHHGSRYSSSLEFLQAVMPQFAVIEVGAGNDYGHPHASTIKRLQAVGAKVLRTDELGEITLVSDGQSIRLKE